MLTSAYFIKIIFPFIELFSYASTCISKIVKWLSVNIGENFHYFIKKRTISPKHLPWLLDYDVATCGVANTTSFYSVATKFSRLVTNLAPKIGDFILKTIFLPRVHLWKKQTPGSRLKT